MTYLSGSQIFIKQDNNNLFYYSNDNVKWNNIIDFPITITNSCMTEFTTPITITSNKQYFICGCDGIQYGSMCSPTIININNVSGYPGLIQNGFYANHGYSNISIINITILSDINTDLYWVDIDGEEYDEGGGYICQQWFGNNGDNNYVINCHSNGKIAKGCGGILGANSSNTTLINCSSNGDIGYNGNGNGVLGAGGIVGARCSFITINGCWSTGNIVGNHSGGIAGSSFKNGCKITNSYSKGSIIGNGSGGIVGYDVIDTIIDTCYSHGNIVGLNCGGIVGMNANGVNISNCYVTGAVNASSGSICGNYLDKTIINIIGCYACGSGNDSIIGNYKNDVSNCIINCYSEVQNGNEQGGWITNNANSVLSGNMWFKYNIPFTLSGLNVPNINITMKRETFITIINLGGVITPLNGFFLRKDLVTTNSDNAGYLYCNKDAAPGLNKIILIFYNDNQYSFINLNVTVVANFNTKLSFINKNVNKKPIVLGVQNWRAKAYRT
jgi:hypothetical protein